MALPGVCTTGLCCKEKGEEGTGGAVCPWLVGPGQGSGRAVVKAGCEQQPQEPSLVSQAVRPGWVRVVWR